MTDRFDNVATSDLLLREQDVRAELKAIRETIKRRLIAESKIIIGRIYRVTDDDRSLAGRLIWVEGLNAGLRGPIHCEDFYCFAWGRMNGRSAAGDGWTIKRQNVSANRLTLVDKADG